MQFTKEEGRIFYEQDHRVVAELRYEQRNDSYHVDHTFVDASLRQQGIANQMMEEYTRLLKEKQMKTTASCSYARHWFSRHPELMDVYVPKIDPEEKK